MFCYLLSVITAGLDVNFQIEVNLKTMSKVFLKGTPLADAFFDGVGLGVSTWGAYASIVADPINLNITNGVGIRDSFVALAANIRSQGPYFATVREIDTSNSNTSQLIPNIAIPVSAEVIFDVNVADYTPSLQ